MDNNVSLIIPLGGRVNIVLLERALKHARNSGHELIVVADRSPSVFSYDNYFDAIAIAKSMADIFIESPEESYFRRGGIWLKLQQGARVASNPWVRFCGYDDLTYPSARVPPELNADAICTDVCIEDFGHGFQKIQLAPSSGVYAALRGWRNPFSFIGWTISREFFTSPSIHEICLKGAFFFERALHVALFSSDWCCVRPSIFGGMPTRTEHRATISTQSTQEDFVAKTRVAEGIAQYSSAERMADWYSLKLHRRVALMIVKNIVRIGSCVRM